MLGILAPIARPLPLSIPSISPILPVPIAFPVWVRAMPTTRMPGILAIAALTIALVPQAFPCSGVPLALVPVALVLALVLVLVQLMLGRARGMA